VGAWRKSLSSGRAERLGKNALHRAPCVLQGAPRLRRAAPQHEAISLMALRKCLILRCAVAQRLAPNFTIAKFRAEAVSDNPAYLAQREHFCEGLRLAGAPEGCESGDSRISADT